MSFLPSPLTTPNYAIPFHTITCCAIRTPNSLPFIIVLTLKLFCIVCVVVEVLCGSLNKYSLLFIFFPCGLCSSYRAVPYIILQNQNKRRLDLFSLAFRKCWGCRRIYCWIYFSCANGKRRRQICAKKDIYCLDTTEFIDRVCFLRCMNKEKLRIKVGSITANRSSKCPPRQLSTTAVTLNCIILSVALCL